jgi:hypothetical protein
MATPSKPLGAVINQFKGAVSKIATREFDIPAGTLWQRDFYERRVPDDALDNVRRYINDHHIPHREMPDEGNPALETGGPMGHPYEGPS